MRKPTILLCFFASILFSCEEGNKKQTEEKSSEALHTSAQLKEDLEVLRTSLEEIHPALYSFISKDSLDFYFAKADKELTHEMSTDNFYRIISPLLKKIQDEHTILNFAYKYEGLKKFLPIKVRWIDGTPFIHKNLLNDPHVIVGSEITSINGKDPKTIYHEIKNIYGKGIDPKIQYEQYSLHFDYLYASFYEQPDSFKITALEPNSRKEFTFKLPAVLAEDTVHFVPIPILADEYCKQDPCCIFESDKTNDYALLKVPGFRPPCGNDFYKKLDAIFTAIHKERISNLIIDLRYNGGGDPKYGAALVSYISRKPIHIFDSLSATLKKEPSYAKFIDISGTDYKTWPKTIEALRTLNEKNGKSTYTAFRDTVFYPKKNHFDGKVYLLINGDIHSAASITSALLDYYVNPVIIGTPIEAPYNCGNAIEILPLILPNSKLEVSIPLIHYQCAIPTNLYGYKQGIQPDVLVSPKISDGQNGKDAILDTALSIIKSRRL